MLEKKEDSYLAIKCVFYSIPPPSPPYPTDDFITKGCLWHRQKNLVLGKTDYFWPLKSRWLFGMIVTVFWEFNIWNSFKNYSEQKFDLIYEITLKNFLSKNRISYLKSLENYSEQKYNLRYEIPLKIILSKNII